MSTVTSQGLQVVHEVGVHFLTFWDCVVVSSWRFSGPLSNHSSLYLLDFLGLTCILENTKFVKTMLVGMLK